MSEPVSVIILGYKGQPWLPKCLYTLKEASARRLHVDLIDNYENPGLDDIDVSAFEWSVIKPDRVLGFAEGNNLGLQTARKRGGYMVFLNQDTWSSPGWIDRCVQVLEDDKTLGAVTPLIKDYDLDQLEASFKMTVPDAAGLTGGESLLEVSQVPATAMVVRSDVLAVTGPFDPVFESYYEDVDLCMRIRKAGFRLAVVPNAILHHHCGSAFSGPKDERRRLFLVHRNRLLYQLRSADGARLVHFFRYLLYELPRRFGRGLVGRPGSQPVGVTLRVLIYLLRHPVRYISARRDAGAWKRYLASLNWFAPGEGA